MVGWMSSNSLTVRGSSRQLLTGPCMTSPRYILLALLFPLLAQAQTHPDGVPPQIGPLKLVKSLQGKEAQSFLNRLHKKEVAPKVSWMGQYSSNSYQATLYVSVYETQAQAAGASRTMTARIKSGNQVFRHYAETTNRGLKISRCLGLGQVHWFFHFRDSLFWLAVDPPIASRSLDSLALALVNNPTKP